MRFKYQSIVSHMLSPLNAELNAICHLLALVGAHHMLHVSRVGVKNERMSTVKPCTHTVWSKELIDVHYSSFPASTSGKIIAIY